MLIVPGPISRKSTRKKFRSTQPATLIFFVQTVEQTPVNMNSLVVTLKKLSNVGFSKPSFRRPLRVVDTVVATVLASFPSQFVVVTVVTRKHAHARYGISISIRVRQVAAEKAGTVMNFSPESQLRSNEMEVVGVSSPLSKRPMLDGCLCHCRNATGKITSSADSSSETFRRPICAKVRRGDACDACEVLSKPFSAFSRRPICLRMPSFLLSVLHEQDFVSKSTAG